MSKAEKFIKDYTKNYSNEIAHWDIGGENVKPIYSPWLTPDQARKAIEIVREEIYDWLNKKLSTYIDYRCRGVGESIEEFVNDLKQAMKDE